MLGCMTFKIADLLGPNKVGIQIGAHIHTYIHTYIHVRTHI